MTAKNILVTGATDGIGRETARQLLALGHRVLVHGRNRDKAERAVRQLAEGGAQPDVAVPVWGDLARAGEILALAQQVRGHCEALDVLVNNAGVLEKRRRVSEDGFEMTMAVNHFAVFLLTRLLLDLVEAAPAGRIVTVSSMVHSSGKLDLGAPSFLRAGGNAGYDAYCASKLANVLFTTELARRLGAGRVTANCLHPGVIGTKLLRAGFAMGGGSVEEGACTTVFLATSDAVAGVTGRYFNDCRETSSSAQARDPALARALWQATEAALRAFLP